MEADEAEPRHRALAHGAQGVVRRGSRDFAEKQRQIVAVVARYTRQPGNARQPVDRDQHTQKGGVVRIEVEQPREFRRRRQRMMQVTAGRASSGERGDQLAPLHRIVAGRVDAQPLAMRRSPVQNRRHQRSRRDGPTGGPEQQAPDDGIFVHVRVRCPARRRWHTDSPAAEPSCSFGEMGSRGAIDRPTAAPNGARAGIGDRRTRHPQGRSGSAMKVSETPEKPVCGALIRKLPRAQRRYAHAARWPPPSSAVNVNRRPRNRSMIVAAVRLCWLVLTVVNEPPPASANGSSSWSWR